MSINPRAGHRDERNKRRRARWTEEKGGGWTGNSLCFTPRGSVLRGYGMGATRLNRGLRRGSTQLFTRLIINTLKPRFSQKCFWLPYSCRLSQPPVPSAPHNPQISHMRTPIFPRPRPSILNPRPHSSSMGSLTASCPVGSCRS